MKESGLRMSHDELPKDVVQIMASLLNRAVLGVIIYIFKAKSTLSEPLHVLIDWNH